MIHSYENLCDIQCACKTLPSVTFWSGICLEYIQKIELLAVNFGQSE